MMDYLLSHIDIQKMLSAEREATVINTLGLLGILPDRVSQNKAEAILGGKAKLKNCIKEGRIKGIPNGNGENSTILYDYAKLIEIRASEMIVIHKAYISQTS